MIDIERIRDELKRNPEPSGPCHVCGARDWWYRLPRLIYNTIPSPGGWVCGRCHPMPGTIPYKVVGAEKVKELIVWQ